tara:strand:- start:860 stop:1936 length:1077 start_codon:yes stop_codon:yes gene_type:complete
MGDLDEEWLTFANSTINELQVNKNHKNEQINTKIEMPKCSDIYISTKTRTCELNSTIDLYNIFWKLNVIKYHTPTEGIIKKSMKFNCNTEEEVKILEENLIKYKEPNMLVNIISQVNKVKGNKKKFKDVRKIDLGLCRKDLLSFRKKKKGAFYNCFAIILRIKYKKIFREVHIKIFNTGKLEIPGIQYDDLLYMTLDKVVDILKPFTIPNLIYKKEKIDTVLINSNFSCGFYVNRDVLHKRLKYTYKIQSAYDPCSYPGIQCKFFYNPDSTLNNGVHDDNLLCKYGPHRKWSEISFMIFRTGSVLIVGNCNENILNIIYEYLKNIIFIEYEKIFIKINNDEKKNSKKKIRKKIILFTN